MNIEEIDKWLDIEYGVSYSSLEEIHDWLVDENMKKDKEIERLNNKEEQLIRRLEDLIIVGEQVENEWAVDICKMIIKELKGDSSDE